ncbi:MAG: restriction endonuclease subunit S [Actinomycetota bacterium]
MSRIDALIAEHCPDGVEFKAVSEVALKSSNIKWSDSGEETYRYIDLSSVDRVTRRIGETANIDSSTAPSRAQQIVRTGDVIFATTRPAQMRWAVIPAEYDGQVTSTGYCVLRPNTSIVLTNFLAHILGADTFRQYIEANQVAGNYPSIPDSRVRAYRIPVPPLEVQREIVRILDQFTQLEAELEAELEARRRQYEYYRNLLVRKNRFASNEWMPLSTLATIRTGSKPEVIGSTGEIPYINAGTETSGFTTVSNARGGVVTIPSRGQGGAGHVGYQEADFWCGPLCYRVDSNSSASNNRFLYFFLRNIQEQIVGLRKVGSIPAVNKSDLGAVLIPVVEINEQRRIVAILDKFDALANDLSIGLPAELAARRKQYEYYRDKLLTFEEASA